MLCMGTSNVWAYGSQRVYPGFSINVGNDYNGSDEVLAPEYEWYEWRF